MRLTIPLRTLTHDSDKWLPPRLLWSFGKGFWGPKKGKYTFISDFKYLMKRFRMKIYDTEAEKFLPQGTKIYDANKIAAVHFNETPDHLKGDRPWPFTKDYVPLSKEDPTFMERPALLFTKHFTLYEGFKGAAVFTNSVFEDEDGLPAVHKDLESRITIDDASLDMLNRKLEYATKTDSVLIPMPRWKEFPKMNMNSRRQKGIHPYRKDVSVLRALQMTSEMMISRRYDFFDRRHIEWPACILALEREGHRIVMDLKTEFVTVVKDTPQVKVVPSTESDQKSSRVVTPVVQSHTLPVFSSSSLTTIERPLYDISPIDWKINFDEVNFYPDPKEWRMGIKLPYKTNTIFVANNSRIPKAQPDRFVKGRCLLFMYGHAVGQARQLFGVPEDETRSENYKDLPDPVMIQGVYFNATKNNLGFMTMQLNTTSFDSQMKNQVWSEGPFDLESDRNIILRKLTAFNLVGADSGILDKVH